MFVSDRSSLCDESLEKDEKPSRALGVTREPVTQMLETESLNGSILTEVSCKVAFSAQNVAVPTYSVFECMNFIVRIIFIKTKIFLKVLFC